MKLTSTRLAKLVIVLSLGFGNLMFCQTKPKTASVDQREARAWQQDLKFMAEQMPKCHKNLFHAITREQFQRAIEQLHKRIPSLSRHQIVVEMARIAASIGDGHTNIAPTRDSKIGFRSYPLKLYFFNDGMFVRAATIEHKDIVGARVTKIGRFSVETAYNVVCEIIGCDNDMDAKFFAPFLLTMPEVLHALGMIDDMNSAAYTLDIQGKQVVVVLKPYGPAEMLRPDTDTSWKLKPGWVDARDSARLPTPLWLKDPENNFWFEYLPDIRTLYVQFNQVGNKDNESVEEFSQRLFAFVDSIQVDRFILDLRLNRGGNGAYNRPLLLGIIKSLKVDRQGTLFTVIGRSTWSAAEFLCNDLEKYTNTLFVGEPSGGKPNSYGDSRKIILPNSGITVRVSSLWWQGDERDTRQWTAPQLAADLTFKDYQNNVDPAMNVILQYRPTKSLTDLLTKALSMGAPASLVHVYQQWKSNPLNGYIDPGPELIDLGYRLMSTQHKEHAIQVFTLCVDVCPGSWNAYDSLGEAYMNNGETDLAIKNYRKSLELNPNNENATEILKKLRAQ